MTYKKIKKELKIAFDQKDAFDIKEEHFIIKLSDFIYIEKQKSFWFAILLIIVVVPISIFICLELLYWIASVL